jgi:hypothetical protein
VWDDRIAVLDDDLMRAVLDQCHEKWSRTMMSRFDPHCVVERLTEYGLSEDDARSELEAWTSAVGGHFEDIAEGRETIRALFVPDEWFGL